MTAILILLVAGCLLCCLRFGGLVDRHDEILRDSENEKY